MKCLLCVQPAEAENPWDLEWDKKCTESICKLLTLDITDHLIFFENVAYCRPCHEFIREIDFTVRTLTLFKEKALELRTILSQKLLPHFENCFSSEQEQSSNIPNVAEVAGYIEPNQKAASNNVEYRINTETSIPTNIGIEEEEASEAKEQLRLTETHNIINFKEEHVDHDSCSEHESVEQHNSNSESILECERAQTLETQQIPQILTVLDLKHENAEILALNHEPAQHPAPQSANLEGNRRSLRPRKQPVRYQTEADATGSEPDDSEANDSDADFSTEEDRDSEYEERLSAVESENEEICDMTKTNVNCAVKIINRAQRQSSAPPASSRLPRRRLTSAFQKLNRNRNRPSRVKPKSEKTKIPHVCGINECTFEADSANWLNLHKAEHHVSASDLKSDNVFPCTVCNLKFTKENLESHMTRVHRPTTGIPTHFQCPGCSRIYGKGKVGWHQFRKFQRHFQKVHLKKQGLGADKLRFKYSCPVKKCYTRFSAYNSLHFHTRKYHEDTAEQFSCAVCGFIFYLSSELKSHEELHKPDSFVCVLGYCHRKWLINPPDATDHGNTETLRTHVKEQHRTEEVIKCTKCTYACASASLSCLKAHILQMHSEIGPNDNYICGVNGCTFEADSTDWLHVHKTEHQISVENGTACSICNIRYSDENLEFHMERVHRPATGAPTHIQCPGCSKKFGHNEVRRIHFSKFQTHFQGVHVPRDPETDTRRFPYLCPVRDCRCRSRTTERLAVHIRKCHENDPKPFKCDKCSQSYKQATQLLVHKRSSHERPAAMCHLCGKSFPSHLFLNYHISRNHLDAEKYLCDICSAKFNFSADCKIHQDLHRPGSFECVLGKCYSCYWKKHQLRKDYGNLERLRQHIQEAHQLHQNGKGKVFYCDKCTYSCNLQHNLDHHMLRHTKEKPFQCTICQKCFKSKVTLEEHEENKHPDPNNMKVYQCKLCPETCHSRQLLYRHTYWHKHGTITKPLPTKKLIQAREAKASRKRKLNGSQETNAIRIGECSVTPDESASGIVKKRRQKRKAVQPDARDTESESEDFTLDEPGNIETNSESSSPRNSGALAQDTDSILIPRYPGLRERPRKRRV